MLIHFLYRAFIITFALSILASATVNAQVQPKLVILNWAEYLDPALIHKFEAEFKVKILQDYYTSDENRTEKLLETNGHGYDVIITSAIDIGRYIKRGWLEPLNENKIPNLKLINKKWRKGFIGSEDYAIPFAWGTTGIIYRNDLVQEPITSWSQFYQPATELKGKISMTGDSQDYISMGLKSLGYSANSEDPEQLKQLEQLLLNQKPYLRSYEYISVQADSAIIKGDVIASMIYNTDALMLQEHSDNLTFVLPKEGGGLWLDNFVIAANSKKLGLAYKFINFFHRPENAVQQALYSFSPTTNLEAEKLLPKDFLNNAIIYPKADSLKNSEYCLPLSPRSQRQRNAIAARILR